MTVYFFVSGDGRVSWDVVDLGCNAMGDEVPHTAVDSPRHSMSWTWLHVCRLSNCGLRVADDCH